MTIANSISKITAQGNGVSTQFSFVPISLFDPGAGADEFLEVVLTNATGAEIVLSEGTGTNEYTVTLNGPYPSSGFITYPSTGTTRLQTGEFLTMRRCVPLLQTLDLENQGGYFADLQEEAFDKLTAMAIKQQDELDRSVKVSAREDADLLNLPDITTRAGKVLGFDNSGNPIAVEGTGGGGSTTASPFMQTVLDDTTADAALGTLGAGAAGLAVFKAATTAEVQTQAGISPFMQTVLDDVSAPLARVTLNAAPAVAIAPRIDIDDNVLFGDDGKLIVMQNLTANRAVTLPQAGIVGEGWTVGVKGSSLGGNIVTIIPFAGEFIDGFASFVLFHEDDTVWMVSDGNNWAVSSKHLSPIIRRFTTSTTYTPTPGRIMFDVTVVGAGGGGGGGGVTAAGQNSIGAGGGAGATASFQIPFATMGASRPVNIGSGGIGANGGSNGATGGASSLGTLINCTGGTGGTGGTAVSSFINRGGGAGGTLSAPGLTEYQSKTNTFGTSSLANGDQVYQTGRGADTPYGTGGVGSSGNSGGGNAVGFGAGGGGGANTGAAGGASIRAGGTGRDGLVIIVEN